MKIRQILSLAFLALLGCTERIQEGGFETGDLQARVLRPDGTPVPAARVWLVRSRGDSAPATVVDSALTDTAGRVRFLFGTDAELAGMGLDARSGDSLGIAPSAFARATAANVTIRETKSVQIGRDSAGTLPSLHVPGSHFASRAGENGTTAVLPLPQGTWDLAIRTPTKAQVLRAVAVTRDTVLAGVAGVPAALQDTSPKIPDTLREGPDIALDSFRVDGMAQYADTSLPPAWRWRVVSTEYGGGWLCDSSFVREDTGWTVLSSELVARNRSPGVVDTLQGFAEIVSPVLPPRGTIALEFAFPSRLASDTDLVRRLQLSDSLGRGVEVFLQKPKSAQDSFGLSDRSSSTNLLVAPMDTAALLGAGTWYFSWTSDSITVRTPQGLVGTAQFQGKTLSSPRLSILVRTKFTYSRTSAGIQRIRLYKTQ